KQLEKNRPIVRAMPWDGRRMSREVLLTREWLVTNGLGGYASGTVSGAVTRRYHGLLIAALPGPLGRVVMWNHVSEFLRFSDDDIISLGAAARRKLPPLRMQLHGREAAFTIAPTKIPQVVYRVEQQRGYSYEGELWSPGFFRVDLTEQSTATLVASTEPWDIINVLGPEDV